MSEEKKHLWVRSMPRYSHSFASLIESTLSEIGRPAGHLDLGMNMPMTRVTYNVVSPSAEDHMRFKESLRAALQTRRFVKAATPR